MIPTRLSSREWFLVEPSPTPTLPLRGREIEPSPTPTLPCGGFLSNHPPPRPSPCGGGRSNHPPPRPPPAGEGDRTIPHPDPPPAGEGDRTIPHPDPPHAGEGVSQSLRFAGSSNSSFWRSITWRERMISISFFRPLGGPIMIAPTRRSSLKKSLR